MRSSRPEVFYKKGVLRNFAKFTGKHLCQSLFFNKVAGMRTATLLKKRLWHRCFPLNFAKFLKKPFSYRTPPVADSVKCFRDNYGHKTLISKLTYYKNSGNPTCIDLMLTNVPHSFQSTRVIETGLSDHSHKKR